MNFTIYHNDEDQMRIRQREHCCADRRGIQNRFMLCRNSQHQAKHSHGSLYACFYIYLFNLCFYHKPPLMCFSIYQETHIYQHTHTHTTQNPERLQDNSVLGTDSMVLPLPKRMWGSLRHPKTLISTVGDLVLQAWTYGICS